MYKAPDRNKNRVTQSFNDGVVIFYTTEDIAKPGYAPQEKLTEKIKLRYEEQRLGINRLYAAKQNNINIERVIRCPAAGNITNQDVAKTEDGQEYRVESIQSVNDVWPTCVDIALTKQVQNVV